MKRCVVLFLRLRFALLSNSGFSQSGGKEKIVFVRPDPVITTEPSGRVHLSADPVGGAINFLSMIRPCSSTL